MFPPALRSQDSKILHLLRPARVGGCGTVIPGNALITFGVIQMIDSGGGYPLKRVSVLGFTILDVWFRAGVSRHQANEPAMARSARRFSSNARVGHEAIAALIFLP